MLITEDFYEEYKPLLFSLAYRLLGSVMDAEDIVQDIFLSANKLQQDKIHNMKAFLCKMTTNRCLDYLTSAQKQRELYVGPWLPEPLIFQETQDPIEQMIGKEYLSIAYLKVMETLSPIERAIFILKEALGFSYLEIAGMVDKTEANCRKIFSRAKQKLAQHPIDHHVSYEECQQNILAFIEAFQNGDTTAILKLVAEDVVLFSDGGGKVTAAIHPILSRQRVLPFLQGVYKKLPDNIVLQLINMNGQLGIANYIGDQPFSMVNFSFFNGQIKEIYILLNPDKMKHL